MKVKDYLKDMIIGQKFIIECTSYLTHDVDPPFEDVAFSTSEYSCPFTGKLRYLHYDVDNFRVCDNSIILCVHDYDFV